MQSPKVPERRLHDGAQLVTSHQAVNALGERWLFMHPSVHAQAMPDKAAVIMADSGRVISYRELDETSNRVAHLLRSKGLEAGDTIAIHMENHPLYFPLVWGAQRAGLHYVCMSSRLTKAEAQYIIEDSGSKLLFTSAALGDIAVQLRDALGAGDNDGDPPISMFMADGAEAGFADLDALLDAQPSTPITDERAGVDMLYSSGTTGRPKGVKIPLPEDPAIDGPHVLTQLALYLYQPNADTIYLSPSPLYHAAPLRWSMTMHRLGATVIVMEHFDAEHVLDLIERYRVTLAQFVPTHFVKMLKLPEGIRARYDHSSLQTAFHAAAPCPIPVKQAMIDWWGPIISEYYAGSEGIGMTHIRADEWLQHPGSVGKALLGVLHICDEEGRELPVGEEGLVYFDSPTAFQYHNDPAKTADSRLESGWMTLGDVGRVDEEGYLTLTDRKSFMIISGGVNIYPQEIENRLIIHPKVADVAIIGAPDDIMGERVVAVIERASDVHDDDDLLRAELETWCRAELSSVKIPRQIDFVEQLPRHPTGKLYKRLLRDKYWGKA